MRKSILFLSLLIFTSCRQIPTVQKTPKSYLGSLEATSKTAPPKLSPAPQVGFQALGGNPFVGGPQAATATSTGTSSTVGAPSGENARPSNLPRVIEAPRTQPLQLPPLPSQETPSTPAVDVPQWNAQSPVLSMGPPARWKNIVNLTVTGIVMTVDGRNKRAVIEEVLQQGNTNLRFAGLGTQRNLGNLGGRSGTTGGQTGGSTTGRLLLRQRSYVVQEGETFSEWGFKVAKIERRAVILRKNGENILLPLITSKRRENFFLPGGTGNVATPGTLPGDTVRTIGPGGGGLLQSGSLTSGGGASGTAGTTP